MSTWPTALVREVVDYPVARVVPEAAPERPFTYIDISAVDAERKEIVAARTMLGREAPSRARQQVLPADVLVSTTRPNLNAVAKVPPELAGAIASTGFAVLRPRAGVDADYLLHWTRSPGFVAAVSAMVKGALYPAVTDRQVLDLMIPLPPLKEQRRIAGRLGDELRAVVDFGPSIERRASTLAALRRSALTTTFEQLLGERRSVGKLADVIKLRNDIVHPRDRPTGTAAFVGLEHIEAGSGRRIGQVPIDLAAMTGRKATFSPGNIVYGYLRPYLNKVWLADIDGFCSVDQYVLEVDARRADSDFVALFMLSDSYLSRAPITTTPGQLPRIRSGEVLSVPAPIPSLADQRRIATRLSEQLAEIDRAKAALAAQRAAIGLLPPALLREVFGAEEDS